MPGEIQTGEYYISTQNGRAYVALLDGNKGTPFTITSDVTEVNKFHTEKKTGGTYTINSVVYFNAATVPSDSSPGTEVVTGAAKHEWNIQETNIIDQYEIYIQASATSKKLYWRLTNYNPGNPIILTEVQSEAEKFKFIRF